MLSCILVISRTSLFNFLNKIEIISATNLAQMASQMVQDIEAKCVMYVYELCLEHKVKPDHGFEHAMHVAGLARLATTDFDGSTYETPNMTIEQVLLVLIASLMHDIDDPKVFPNSVDYANARRFLEQVPLSTEQKESVIMMIHIVSYSKNGNEIDDTLPLYMYIPRDADRAAVGGHIGIRRTLEFNKHNETYGQCPLVTKNDVKLFDGTKFPVSTIDVMSKMNFEKSDRSSLFRFYITNWANRDICASGSVKLEKIMRTGYATLLDWMTRMINYYQKNKSINYDVAYALTDGL